MSQAPPSAAEIDPATFDALDRTLTEGGRGALLDRLIRELDSREAYRALLDALLLKARHDLGLPLIQVGPLNDLAEPARSAYEERYVEAIRTVGGKLLAAGDIAAAWPYFRAIGEFGPVQEAIEAFQPEDADERINAVVEVAFNQGAHPRRGYELILKHYGTCPAVTAFENLPRDEATRVACAGLLVAQVHEHLVANLRAEIQHRGQPLPPEGTPIPSLIEGRDWLFSDEAYHIDVSHLAATVRVGPMLTDPAAIERAWELAEYGRHLSPRHAYEGDPPFERVYDDHAVYFQALRGQGVEEALRHFRDKIVTAEADGESPDLNPAQVLVGLLSRLGRLDEALDVAAEHLGGVPDSALFCPGVAQLSQRTGKVETLARVAREHGDLVHYAAAILQSGGESG